MAAVSGVKRRKIKIALACERTNVMFRPLRDTGCCFDAEEGSSGIEMTSQLERCNQVT